MRLGLGLGLRPKRPRGSFGSSAIVLPNFVVAATGSVFAPTDIAGLQLWLRADQGVTLNSGNVAQWNDLSGNGFNATQGTAGSQPLLEASGFGGLPSVKFDAVDDFLGANGAAAFASGSDKALTAILAMQFWTNPVANFRGTICWDKASDATPAFSPLGVVAGGSSPTRWLPFRRDDAATFVQLSTLGNPDLAANVISVVFSGTAISIFKNGTADLSGQPVSMDVSTMTVDQFSMGAQRPGGTAGSFQPLRLAELVLYDTALSDANRQKVESYMKTRYGTP